MASIQERIDKLKELSRQQVRDREQETNPRTKATTKKSAPITQKLQPTNQTQQTTNTRQGHISEVVDSTTGQGMMQRCAHGCF